MNRLIPHPSSLKHHSESLRSEAEVRGEKAKSEQDEAFDAWLRRAANARRVIAESNHPDLVHAAMRLAFAEGVVHGYRDGVLVGTGITLGEN